jgi:hypothetical protein
MARKLTEQDAIFDGFAHRNFREDIDGWRNELPDASDYPCVQNALGVVELFRELQDARREIWELKRELGQLRPLRDNYAKF